MSHPSRFIAAAIALLAGCSFVTVKGPPSSSVAVTTKVECTESVAVPIVDTVLAATYLALGLFIVSKVGFTFDTCNGECYAGAIGPMGPISLAVGALFTASAVTGYGRTSRCRGFQRTQSAACLEGDTAACAALYTEPAAASRPDAMGELPVQD